MDGGRVPFHARGNAFFLWLHALARPFASGRHDGGYPQAPVLFASFFLGAILEEIGWTGYATGPLQERYGVFRAGLIIGAVWAA
jgi:membrane protease YdiL (CAAX protease family)